MSFYNKDTPVKEYLQNDHCHVFYDEAIDTVCIEWLGAPKGEAFRSACMVVIDALRAHQTSKVLTNNSRALVFAVDDQEWLNKVWLPQAEQAGYRVSATVVKDDAFIRFIVDRIAKQRDDRFTTKVFKELEEAREWLKTIG